MFFFFQAEDGIRYLTVTGVQTCALPICKRSCAAFSRGGRCEERLPPSSRRSPRRARSQSCRRPEKRRGPRAIPSRSTPFSGTRGGGRGPRRPTRRHLRLAPRPGRAVGPREVREGRVVWGAGAPRRPQGAGRAAVRVTTTSPEGAQKGSGRGGATH